jgi:hypothetical protein
MQHFLSFVFSSSSLLSLLFYFTWYQSPLANTSQSWFLLRCNTPFQPFYQTRLTYHMVLSKNRASSLPLPTFQLHPHRNYPRFYSISVLISISPNLLSFTQKKKNAYHQSFAAATKGCTTTMRSPASSVQ